MTERKKLESQLRKMHESRHKSFGKVLFHFKRSFDQWALLHLSQDGYPEMKLGYMPFVFNIGADGITNNELASRLNVTKQAISKTLKEMEKLNIIEFKPHPNDARSSLVLLTNRGIKMVLHIRKSVDKLAEKYAASIGNKTFEEMIQSMNTLIALHESWDK